MLHRRALVFAAILAVGCSGASEDPPAEAVSPKTGRSIPLQKPIDDPDVKLDLSYEPAPPAVAHRLDLYLPKGASNVPLLVYVHGGAWIGGDKGLYRFFGEALRREGIAVAVVNYRLSLGKQLFVPEHTKDVAAAVSFLAANKAKYPYDPKRIFLIGHSAGAHTIAYLTADASLYRNAGVPSELLPKGYIGLEGIYDIPAIYKVHPNYKEWFLASAFGDEKNWAKGSPTLMPIAGKAPWIVVHSAGDNLVETSQADGFAAHLNHSQVPVELVKVQGLSHDDVVQDALKSTSPIHVVLLKMVKP